jgi:pimeloyl-ACP methyl ester carboxylesterase
MIHYRTVTVSGHNLFYREAGEPKNPTLLLLHGFPTSSHMFRDLIPVLADRYHVVAPDLPGFGNAVSPPRGRFDYTFDNLAQVIGGFVDALHPGRHAMYVFNYGAPVGYRLAAAHPERIAAIVSQNGNANLEGFSGAWGVWQAYWKSPTPENREACRRHAGIPRKGRLRGQLTPPEAACYE